MTLLERVSKAICEAALHGDYGRPACPWCHDKDECTEWRMFEKEAKAAVAAVRKSDRGK